MLALQRFEREPGAITVNLGTGQGTSVLELVKAFKEASGRDVPVNFAPRRSGDIAAFWADPAQAQSLLGWQAEYDISDMCRDQWAWQSQNPNGYETT